MTPVTRNCQDSPTGQTLLGIRQFNSRQWYECHETFELLWNVQQDGEVRYLYQGIIQLAIALSHWRNKNFNGSVKLLKGSASYLGQVCTPCLWIDVNGLLQQTVTFHEALLMAGEKGMVELDESLIPYIRTVSV